MCYTGTYHYYRIRTEHHAHERKNVTAHESCPCIQKTGIMNVAASVLACEHVIYPVNKTSYNTAYNDTSQNISDKVYT